MPACHNSIFFSSRGHAVHGSDHPGLGTPVSHGCVRLSLTNAATLYQLVGGRGIGDTTVSSKAPIPPDTLPPPRYLSGSRRRPLRPAVALRRLSDGSR